MNNDYWENLFKLTDEDLLKFGKAIKNGTSKLTEEKKEVVENVINKAKSAFDAINEELVGSSEVNENLNDFEFNNTIDETLEDFQNAETKQENKSFELPIDKEKIEKVKELLTGYENIYEIKKIIEKLKKNYHDIKINYVNYKSLDDVDKKQIIEDAKIIQKEHKESLKHNLLLAIQFFNELNQDNQEYFDLMNKSIIEEINKRSKEKKVKEKKYHLACKLFDSYIIKVDVVFNSILKRMVNNDISEDEMYFVISDLLELHNKVLATYELVTDEIKDKYYVKLNDKAQTLYTIIDEYNSLANSNISIVQTPIDMDDSIKIDINNTVIALSEGKLDIFKCYHYKQEAPLYGRFIPSSYNEGIIYEGLTTSETAINKKHLIVSSVDVWSYKGGSQIYNNKLYTATTSDFNQVTSYKQLRDEMYKSKKEIIPYYVDGFAPEYEILEVLSYGSKLFGLKSNKQKTL